MNRTEIKIATEVVARANGWEAEHPTAGISYSTRDDAEVVRAAGRVWYPVTGRRGDEEWMYYLAKDAGSYRGLWPDELGVEK